jgi:hypothetical protein
MEITFNDFNVLLLTGEKRKKDGKKYHIIEGGFHRGKLPPFPLSGGI